MKVLAIATFVMYGLIQCFPLLNAMDSKAPQLTCIPRHDAALKSYIVLK